MAVVGAPDSRPTKENDMKYLLLDTNIYLHYTDFEQIDWAAIVNDEHYTIIVPFTVIKEIDKHKDGPKSKIRTRAKAVSSKFGSYFLDDNCKRKVELIALDEPSSECMEKFNLNNSISDDVIIGSALSFEHKESIIVISHDNTLLIKAKKFGLGFIAKMPERYLLAEEKSEEEKEYERCRKELEQLRNRQPKPYMTFDNGTSEYCLSSVQDTDISLELDGIVSAIKSEHPYMTLPSITREHNTRAAFPIENISQLWSEALQPRYTIEEIEKYNDELDDFYENYEKYHRTRLECELLDKYFKELKFNIVNTGTAETGEMTIFLEFPQHIKLYNIKSKRYINYIREPEAPRIGHRFNDFGLGMGINQQLSSIGGMRIPQMSSWDATKSLSKQTVIITSKSLIHNINRSLSIDNSLYIDTRQCGNFSIKWNICAAGCANAQSGMLNVIIK